MSRNEPEKLINPKCPKCGGFIFPRNLRGFNLAEGVSTLIAPCSNCGEQIPLRLTRCEDEKDE